MNAADETPGFCFFRAKNSTREGPLEGLLDTDNSRQEPARARLGHHCSFRENETVTRFLRRQANVCCTLECCPDADGGTVTG